jgi:ankyrin repeat protein
MTNRRTFVSLLAASQLPTGSLSSQAPAKPDTKPDARPASTDIFTAALNGDIPAATALAEQNPAIARLRSADHKTALHYAVQGGHSDMIFFLSQRGADLSAGPESPLLTAVDYPDHAVATDMSMALLINASDPNAKRADGKTALDLASARGYTDIVEMLVHRGATLPAGGSAAANVKTERVYYGKRYSFDVHGQPYVAENLDGLPQDFINEFARLSHFDVERVKHLAKLAPALVAGRATWDESGIEAASHVGLIPLARFLADAGAAVSTCTATLLGLRDRVEALVKSDPACVRERGAHDLPLMAYTAYGEQHAEIADFLLDSGAAVETKAFGITTLHIAAGKGYTELAEVLLAHGADINAAGSSRGSVVTPLAIAVRSKQDRMAEFLKSRGGRT